MPAGVRRQNRNRQCCRSCDAYFSSRHAVCTYNCGGRRSREKLASMATLTELLEKGYFPRELPPPFHTDLFAAFAVSNGGTWTKKKWTRSVAHNLARPGGLRRPLKIPNPLSYLALAEILAANWVPLKTHTWAARLSASRPHVMKLSQRAVVPRYRYGELPRLRALRRRSWRAGPDRDSTGRGGRRSS